MALKLQVSNSLISLANQLCADLKAENNTVFRPNYIITQTEGMNNWLKMQLASNLGIAANYHFLKPNDLIHQTYQILGGQFLQPLSAENQCWVLFKLLAEKDFSDRFKTISAYYTTEGPDKHLKRMALAEKVADLFDQYQMYRPELIDKWNSDSLNEVAADEWQQYLWIKAKQILEDKLPDKTVIGKYILK